MSILTFVSLVGVLSGSLPSPGVGGRGNRDPLIAEPMNHDFQNRPSALPFDRHNT